MTRVSDPTVSIIIPAYNALPYLERCLQSVVDQTLERGKLEVIVIDDGSTDGTDEAADRWSARYPELFRVLHRGGSGGPAGPRNVGLDAARGEYVFFLDADDFLGEEALERMLAVAREQDSDIVLGRMVSHNGRGVPESMFKRTNVDADLARSRVYWTLAPLKLFRRALIEENRIRFPEHLPNGSDQPFTATAYFRAKKISALADYDYYFVVQRDDGGHVTQSGSASNRADIVEEMCALVAREVPEVSARVPFLTRHLQIDLGLVMSYLPDLPLGEQEALFGRIRALLEEHLDDEILRRLTPDLRVAYSVALGGSLDRTVVAARAFVEKPSYAITTEAGRVYAHLPFFRDPDVGVADECYDVTDRVRVVSSLTTYACRSGILRLGGSARFPRVRGSQVQLIVQRRDRPARKFVVPVTHDDDGTFEGSVDVSSLRDGKPLAAGVWDIYVRVVNGDLRETARLGTGDRCPEPTPVALSGMAGRWNTTLVPFLTPAGTFSLDLGRTKFRIADLIGTWRAQWEGTELALTTTTAVDVDLPVAIELDTQGSSAVFDGQVREATISVSIPVDRLQEGRWRARVRIGPGATPLRRRLSVKGLPSISWRRRMSVWSVDVVRFRPTLNLDIDRRSPAQRLGAAGRAVTGRQGSRIS